MSSARRASSPLLAPALGFGSLAAGIVVVQALIETGLISRFQVGRKGSRTGRSTPAAERREVA